jgi:hypothetical protein
MPVAVLAVLVGRRRVLLSLLMLAVGVMVRRLEVVVGGGVMARGGQVMMLDSRVLARLCHRAVLLFGEKIGDTGNEKPPGPRRGLRLRGGTGSGQPFGRTAVPAMIVVKMGLLGGVDVLKGAP